MMTVDGLQAEIFEVSSGFTVEAETQDGRFYLGERGVWQEQDYFWPSYEAAKQAAAGYIENHWMPTTRKKPGFLVKCFDGVQAIVSSDGPDRWYICAELQPNPRLPKSRYYLNSNGLWEPDFAGRWQAWLQATEFAKAGPPGRLGMRGVPRFRGVDITECCPVCHKEYVYDTEQDAYEGVTEWQVHVVDDKPVVPGKPSLPKKITLHLCPADRGVIAVTVDDEHGGTVFIPSTKEI